jgi:uncharacterized membrane protein
MTEESDRHTGTPGAMIDAATGEAGPGIAAHAAAVTRMHGGQALLVARFADIDAASTAYDALRDAERTGAVDVDGLLVVTADAHGRVHIQTLTDHTTRRGMAWGAVAGAALAIIFPPSILVGAVAAGIAGAVMGKAYHMATKSAVAEELASVMTPGTSGIVALVATDAVDGVRSTIPEAVLVKVVPVDDATSRVVLQAAAGTASPGASEVL